MELLKKFKKFYLGYEKGQKLDIDPFITKRDREYLITISNKFKVYENKFALLISLYVIYKFHPQSFSSFMEKVNETLHNREGYFKFKELLQNPYEYIKKDLHYLMENHITLEEEELLNLFLKEKISIYSFYMLLKDKAEMITSKEIIKSFEYILQFQKIKIDASWYDGVIVKNKKKSLF